METKFNEEVTRTSVLEEMKDKYLAERLLRTWHEDFTDEDTGEVVSIERNEIIFDKGIYLSNDIISQINFHLQAEDIKEVSVSNQKRCGKIAKGYDSIWQISASVYGKKKTYLLYANSVQMAIEIVIDYLEQIIEGSFVIVNVKELSYDNLIPRLDNDTETERDFYKTEVEVTYDGLEPFNRTYILQAKDAENAKNLIISFIALEHRKQDKKIKFDVTMLSAQTISCTDIIHYEFSKEYFEKYKK